MKRQAIWGLISLAAFAASALAQEASQPSDQQGGRQQRRQRQNGQGGPGAAGQRGPGQRGGFGMNLPESLKLTDDQKTKVQEIQRNAFQEMRQQQGAAAMTPEDRQKMMDLRQQLRAAAQAGDDAKVAELQSQLDNSAFSQSRTQMQASTDKQIAEILTPDQRKQFEQWTKLRDSGLPPMLIDRPDALKTAALKIETLSDVQKNGIEAAYERYDRGATHADDLTKATLTYQFANEVMTTLKPGQKVLLTSQAMQGAGGRGGRGGGRGGNGAGGPNAPADGAGGAAGGAAPSAPQPAPANQ